MSSEDRLFLSTLRSDSCSSSATARGSTSAMGRGSPTPIPLSSGGRSKSHPTYRCAGVSSTQLDRAERDRLAVYHHGMRRGMWLAALFAISTTIFFCGYAVSGRTTVQHPLLSAFQTPQTTKGPTSPLSVILVTLGCLGFLSFAILGVIAEIQSEKRRKAASQVGTDQSGGG
jgi:hypothetical protein